MKNFADLSDLEIYNLSPEQIKTYEKIELTKNAYGSEAIKQLREAYN
mgnify:CR=1 FL=1